MTLPNPTKALDKPFSEVIYSTGEMIFAQCYKESTESQIITQGTIVKVMSSYDSSHTAFGLISKINNSSLDNIHKPSALGLRQEELTKLQPQVYDLLRKELEIYLFAHLDKSNQILCYPPTKPMMIHDFVYLCNKEELLKLTLDFASLFNIIKKNKLKIELLLEPIFIGYKLRNHDNNYLVKQGQELSLSFLDDIESLMPALKRLQFEAKANPE